MTTTLEIYFNRELSLENLSQEAATVLIKKNAIPRKGESFEQYETRILARARARVSQNNAAAKTRGMVMCHLRHEYTNYDAVLASVPEKDRNRVRLSLQQLIEIEAERTYPVLSRFNMRNPVNTMPLFLSKNRVIWDAA